MKAVSVIILMLGLVLFTASVVETHRHLPGRVASQFDAAGAARGWMDRTAFTSIMVTVGLGVPVLLIGLLYAVRFLPASSLNVPNPSYWSLPENHRRAGSFLLFASLWFAGAFLVWMACLSRLVLAANRLSPPHLDSTLVFALSFGLVVFALGWTAVLVLRFFRIG
jgi:uncharacterized membrane protein